MSTTLARYGFGTKWTDIHTDSFESFRPNMTDYHMHDYYEISLILSGNVHVLLSDICEYSTQPKIVLLRPYTPHYIYCEPDMLYSRRNIGFHPDLLMDYSLEWKKIMQVFGKSGSVLKITKQQCDQYREIFENIHSETDLFRKKLLLLYLLSLVTDTIAEAGDFSPIPAYVTDSLAYLSTHYGEHIIAGDLAERFEVGRTTLMTAFKKYTGMTVNNYLTRCRLKNAVGMLQKGLPQHEVATKCGFCDACGLIRSFRRIYGVTPKHYLTALK